MGKRKANHVISGMNAASAQGQGTGYNEESQKEILLGFLFNAYNVTIPKLLQIDTLPFEGPTGFFLMQLPFDYDHFLRHAVTQYLRSSHFSQHDSQWTQLLDFPNLLDLDAKTIKRF